MKRFFLLVLSFSFVMSMEQSPQVARLEQYTLISNDGNEITLDGQTVREYVPGLAEQFRAGMVEARSGKIKIAHLDGQALKNFKTILEITVPKEAALQQENNTILSATQKAIEQTVFAPGQEAQENEVRSQLLMKGMASVRKLADSKAVQIKSEIEQLPEIGEHFLSLFNAVILWHVPYIMQLAFAQFAAEQIDIKDGYAQLKDLDPRVQLLYLHEAEFSVESIMSVYQWFAQLGTHAATLRIAGNKELYDDILEKIVEYTAHNIQAIFAKHPHFKTIFEKPEFKNMSDLLRQEFLSMNLEFFTKIIRPAVRWPGANNLPLVSDLGNQIIALRDNEQRNNIYDFKNEIFKSSSQINQNVPVRSRNRNPYGIEYRFWSPDRLIKYYQSTLEMYDVNTNQKIFGYRLMHTANLMQVKPIGDNLILVKNDRSELFTFIYNRDLGTLSESEVSKIGPVWDVVLISEEEYFFWNIGQPAQHSFLNISLYNTSLNRVTKEKRFPIPNGFFLAGMKKINNNELGVWITYGPSELPSKYLRISISDLNLISTSDIPSCIFGRIPSCLAEKPVELVPMSFEYALLKEGYDITSLKLSVYNITTQTQIPLERLKSAVVLDKNHIAAFDGQSNNFVIVFLPFTSTLSEILDEIQKKVAPQGQQSQQAPKRPAGQEPERPIPAAAQGLRPAARAAKQPRLEKPNG